MAGIDIITGFNLSAESALDRRTVVADTAARLALAWVYKGLLVYQVDSDTFYKYIGIPPSNTAPDWQVILNTGLPGTPGSVWFDGSGVPGGGLGIDGDYYLDNTSGNVYNKAAGVWSIVANIKGPTGASGTSSGDFASLLVTAGVTAQGLNATDALITQFVTNGPFTGAVPDATTDKITITNPGDYLIYLNADVIGIAAKQYQLTVYLNGVATVVLGTFDTTVDTRPNISFQQVINVPTPGLELTLYGKQVTAGTENLTVVTGAWGALALNAVGPTGAVGKAFIHIEHDLGLAPNANFDNAKVISVQAGSWTPQNPWSASIASDGRSPLSVPAALTGSKEGRSVSYDGTNWYDNGRWRGPSGSIGFNGDPGPAGPSGTAAVGTVNTGAPGSSVIITNSGVPSAAIFNFTIPRGDVGAASTVQGPPGAPGFGLTVETFTTVAAGVVTVKTVPVPTNDALYWNVEFLCRRVSSITYAERIINGNFAAGLASWSQIGGTSGTWTAGGGVATVTVAGFGQTSPTLLQAGLSGNVNYNVSLTITKTGSFVATLVWLNSSNGVVGSQQIIGTGTLNLGVLTSPATTTKIGFFMTTGADPGTTTLDNISVQEAVAGPSGEIRGLTSTYLIRNVSGTLNVYETSAPLSWGDVALAALDINVGVSGANAILTVAGLTNSTIRWTWAETKFLNSDS